MNTFKALSIALFMTAILPNAGAVDIYIYDFNVTTAEQANAVSNEPDIARISAIIQNAFSALSSEAISYKAITVQAPSKLGGTVRTIDNTVSALAVCFFFDIDLVMYGDVGMEKTKQQYTTGIKVYSKSQDSVIYELEYAKIVPAEEKYFEDLASVVNGQLRKTLSDLPQSASEKKIEQMQDKIGQAEAEKKEEAAAENADDGQLLTYMDKLLGIIEKQQSLLTEGTGTSTGQKSGTQAANTEKVFGLNVGIGYFFELAGVWKNLVIPLTTVQIGPKWNFLLYDTEVFDFYFRPGLFLDYSFSMNDFEASYNLYSRIQSAAGALGLEFAFEFVDLFGFYFGGGGEYNFDIVVFREGVTKDYYAYNTSALGAYGCAGFELTLGAEKNFVIGIHNSVRLVFYNTTYIDYKLMLTTMFKI